MVLPFISVPIAIASILGTSPTTIENHAILLAFQGKNVDGRLVKEEERRSVETVHSRSRQADMDGDGQEVSVAATYVSPGGTPAASAIALVIASRPNGPDTHPIVPDYVAYGFRMTVIGAPGNWVASTLNEQIIRQLDELIEFEATSAGRLPA